MSAENNLKMHMNTLTILLGIFGLAFLLGFGYWFVKHPISRDQLLMQFGAKYFMLVASIMVASTFVIAMFLPADLSAKGDLGDNPLVTAIQLCVKMREAKDLDIHVLGFLFLMLFQIVVFEGLVLAAIVGWTGRRTDQLQKGAVRYTRAQLCGAFVSKWDKISSAKGCRGKLRSLFCQTDRNSYAVVIGANEVAASVIKNLLLPDSNDKNNLKRCHEVENKYVILQTTNEVADVRRVLRSHLTEDECDRVIIYNALRDSLEELQELHLEGVSEIYILGESTSIDGGETYHDAMNMRCLNMVASVLSEYKNTPDIPYHRKPCKVMFEYQTTQSVFQSADITQLVNDTLFFIPFNRYESWARMVFADCAAREQVDTDDSINCLYPEIHYLPLDGEGIKPDDKDHVHLVVVGMSKMGIALGIQAISQMHYPNFSKDKGQLYRSKLTFIDTNADAEMAFFKGRYSTLFELVRSRYIDASAQTLTPWYDPMEDIHCKWRHLSNDQKNFMDLEVEFIKGSLESDGVRKYLTEIAHTPNTKLTIAICLTQTHQAIAASLYMPDHIYDSPQLQQILVYQREASDLITTLAPVDKEQLKKVDKKYQKLKPFGMIYGNYMDDRTRYLKAMLVNSAYLLIGENAQLPWPTDMNLKENYKTVNEKWKTLGVTLKMSNKLYVDTIYQKLRCVMSLPMQEQRYHGAIYQDQSLGKKMREAIADNIDALAVCEHNRWNVEKLLYGWIPCDELEDACLVSYIKAGDDAQHSVLKKRLKQDKKHPNLCDYAHLAQCDPSAYQYDLDLCLHLPDILLLVDGYHSPAAKKWIEYKNNSNIQ